MKVLIIDDEPLARDLIKNFLQGAPDVEISGEAADGFQGIKLIRELNPDLVFLDVQMPKLTGFEMLEVMENYPMIIFTTAYDEFAIQAFEKNAVDYLLKPFSRERLLEALRKARHNFKPGKIRVFAENIQSENQKVPIDRVVVKSGTRIHIIPVEKIWYLEAQDDYVMIYCDEGKFLKQQTLKYFEDHLPENTFLRSHRSYIVKLDMITRIEPFEKDSHRVILKNDHKVPVSKAGYTRLREKLNL